MSDYAQKIEERISEGDIDRLIKCLRRHVPMPDDEGRTAMRLQDVRCVITREDIAPRALP